MFLMQKIVKISCKNLDDVKKLINYSTLCIELTDIDYVEDKQATIDLVLDKLRINGEIIIDYLNMNKIINDYSNNLIPYENVVEYIKNAPFTTSYEDILKCVDRHKDISIYKVVEQNNMDIISLTRTSY